MATYNKESIKALTEQLLKDTGSLGIFPCPVEKIISALGFTAHLFNPSSDTQNISGAVDHKNAKIYINANEPSQRRLFTAAHEIAHIKLHPNNNHVDFRDLFRANEPNEKEANLFAANLLMPEAEFRKQWKFFSGDITKLSYFFGTSKTAIAYRAEELELE